MTSVFVFGSNLAGRHGKGAALHARQKHGAEQYVAGFVVYAKANPDLTFQVTRVGCGLAGYADHQIAPMFKGAPKNCVLPAEWVHWTGQNGDDYTKGGQQ